MYTIMLLLSLNNNMHGGARAIPFYYRASERAAQYRASVIERGKLRFALSPDIKQLLQR